MKLFYRSGVCALALAAGAAALTFEPTVMRDLVADASGARLSIGAVRAPLWSAAFAQSADTFSLDNVRLTFGFATYEAKRIEFSGVTSSRADVEALFAQSSPDSLATRLGRINAKQISIPELKVSQTLAGETQTVIYKNAVLSNVVQGKIASIVIDATAAESVKNTAVFSYGRTVMNELDIPAFARLYETKAASDNEPFTKIHGAFSIENVDVTDKKEGVSARIAKIGGRDFLARPTKDSWAATAGLFLELGQKDNPTIEDSTRILASMADFLDAFQMGSMEAVGIEIKTDPKADPKAKEKAQPVAARIGRMGYTGAVGGQPADMRMEGFDVTDRSGHVKLDTVSLTGFSFKPTVRGLKQLAGRPLDQIDAAALRALAPVIGTLRVEGLDIDAVATNEKTKKNEPVKASLKSFEFTAEAPVNAIPTRLRIGFQNFAMALPAASKDEGIKDLIDLGYKALDISAVAAADWNEANREIALKEVTIQGKDMGSVTLTGTLGNVSKDVFDSDTAVASVALISSAAKSLDLTVENKGLFERFLAKTAKEQKTTPEALRRTYASAAAIALPAMVGGSEQAKALSQSLARFIAQPNRLSISAQAKDPSGLGIADVVTLSEPKAVFERLNVTSKAE